MTTRILTTGIAFAAVLLTLITGQSVSYGQQPEWTGRVLKVGIDRQYTDSIDILERPYRPFHFYGNTVRRMHYRGFPLPLPVDFFMSGYAMLYERDLWFADKIEQPSSVDVNPTVQRESGLAEYQVNNGNAESDPSNAKTAENSSSSKGDGLKTPIEFVSNIKNVDPSTTSSATDVAEPILSKPISLNVAKIVLSSIEDVPFRDSINSFKLMPVDSEEVDQTIQSYR